MICAVYRYKFLPSDVYNIDETGFTTVQVPATVVSTTGKKQVGAVTSGERGQLVTVLCSVNASGTSLPPFYIFPRVRMNPAFLNGCLPGSAAAAAKSGWMSSDIFSDEFLPHFVRQTRCSKAQPVLLLMDNHESHISLKSITIAKENGIVVLTLPPHTSHRLQPLDRSIYGPMKTFYNRACDEWMRSNPGRQISIYEVGALTARAHTLAITPSNIMAGFSSTGIHPLNSDIFPEEAFLPSDVTDRPAPAIAEGNEQGNEQPPLPTSPCHRPTPSKEAVTTPLLSKPSEMTVTPQELNPISKAPPRKM